MNFSELHTSSNPLVIGNVWDAASAVVAEKMNFKAIGTSSAAIASMLGYEDGEKMSFDELFFIVQRIKASSALPLTVDIESGFSSDINTVIEHIKRLADIGVVGINIEDSIVKTDRELVDAKGFFVKLQQIKQALVSAGIDMFINVRTDTFILGLGNALEETLSRLALYQEAEIDGFFVPCVTSENDILKITAQSKIPVNVMCMPELPDFKKLAELGVSRVSMGNFLFDSLQGDLESKFDMIQGDKSFDSVFS